MNVPPQDKTIVRFEIAPRSIAWVLATIAAVWLFLHLRFIALLVVVALVFAGTFNPLVEWMERHGLKRIYALILLFVALLVGTCLLIFLTVPPLVEQLTQIVADAPAHRTMLIGLLQEREVTAPLARALEHAPLEQTFARVETHLVNYTPQALVALGYAVTTLVLAFYLLADGKRAQGTLYAMVPRGYHMRLARILHNLEMIVGGYMRGQLITSALLGSFTFLLLFICKIPNALSLSLFAALADVVPFVGAVHRSAQRPVRLSGVREPDPGAQDLRACTAALPDCRHPRAPRGRHAGRRDRRAAGAADRGGAANDAGGAAGGPAGGRQRRPGGARPRREDRGHVRAYERRGNRPGGWTDRPDPGARHS